MADIETNIRRSVLEIDLLNSLVIDATHILDLPNGTKINQPIKILPDVMERFKTEVVGDTFHMEGDELQHVIFYSDDTAIIQRKKLKYDFATDSATAVQYIFNGATKEQILALKARVIDLISASRIVREKQIQDKIVKMSEEKLFYDAKMNKRLEERKAMLKGSDWRVLPDIEDSYEGEKAQWIAWRAKIRSIAVPTPEQYGDKLEFARTLFNQVYPMDPKNYRKRYPNGLDEDGNAAPAFMDPNDEKQWTSYDDDASSDFFNSRMINKLIYARQRVIAPRIVEKDIKEIIKDMRIEEIFPEFDIEMFQVEDE